MSCRSPPALSLRWPIEGPQRARGSECNKRYFQGLYSTTAFPRSGATTDSRTLMMQPSISKSGTMKRAAASFSIYLTPRFPSSMLRSLFLFRYSRKMANHLSMSSKTPIKGTWARRMGLILLTLVPAIIGQHTTSPVYINQVPAYSSLSTCAVIPLSRIVRNMEEGCGDESSLTSFDCFCSTSSSTMIRIIQRSILANCEATPPDASMASDQVSSAFAVYANYCRLPLLREATATTGKQRE